MSVTEEVSVLFFFCDANLLTVKYLVDWLFYGAKAWYGDVVSLLFIIMKWGSLN